jgi:predicted peroxiredoxin
MTGLCAGRIFGALPKSNTGDASLDDHGPTKERQMADKVVINLATGLEDAERVTVAFLVAGAAVEQGRRVAMFLTKEAVRLALPGYAEAVACEGCPPLSRLFEQYADGGGELLVCPICFAARKLDEGELTGNARLAGATPLWQWIGTDPVATFSY